MEISANLLVKVIDQLGEPLEGINATIYKQNSSEDFTTDENGNIEKELIPDNYELEIKLVDEQKNFIISNIDGLRYKLTLEKENNIELERDLGVVS